MDQHTQSAGLHSQARKMSRSFIDFVKPQSAHFEEGQRSRNESVDLTKTHPQRTSSRSQHRLPEQAPKFKSRWRGQPLTLQIGQSGPDDRAKSGVGASHSSPLSPRIRNSHSMSNIGNRTPTTLSTSARAEDTSRSPIRESYATWNPNTTRSPGSTPADISPITPAQMYSLLYERVMTPIQPATPLSPRTRYWDGDSSDDLSQPEEDKSGSHPYFDRLLLPAARMPSITDSITEEPDLETDDSTGESMNSLDSVESTDSEADPVEPPGPTRSIQQEHDVEAGDMDHFIADFTNVAILTSRHRSNSCPAPTIQSVRTRLRRSRTLFSGLSLDSEAIMRGHSEEEDALTPTAPVTPRDDDLLYDAAAPPVIQMPDDAPAIAYEFDDYSEDDGAAPAVPARRSSLSRSRRRIERLTPVSNCSQESLPVSEDRTIVSESPVSHLKPDDELHVLTKGDLTNARRERPVTMIHIPTGNPAFLAGEADELQLPDTPVSAIFHGHDAALEPPPVPARSPLRETFSLSPVSSEFPNRGRIFLGPSPEPSLREPSIRDESPTATLIPSPTPEIVVSEVEGTQEDYAPTVAPPSTPDIFVSEIRGEEEDQDSDVPILVVSSSTELEETKPIKPVYKMPSYIKPRSVPIETHHRRPSRLLVDDSSRPTSPMFNFSRPRPISPTAVGCVMSTISVVADIKPTTEAVPVSSLPSAPQPRPQSRCQQVVQPEPVSTVEAAPQPNPQCFLQPISRRGSMESVVSQAPSILSVRWMQSSKERLGLGGLLRKSEDMPWETDGSQKGPLKSWRKGRASQLFSRTQFLYGERKLS